MHEKHFRFHRCIESLHDLSLVGMYDISQRRALTDILPHLHQGFKNAGLGGTNADHFRITYHSGGILLMRIPSADKNFMILNTDCPAEFLLMLVVVVV